MINCCIQTVGGDSINVVISLVLHKICINKIFLFRYIVFFIVLKVQE